jgi:hypothetical protein
LEIKEATMIDADKQNGLVLTPGGLRPEEMVHRVATGEAVTTTPDGQMLVIPGSEAAQAQAQGLVLTPGGWRPKSQVHHVEPGHVIDGAGGHLRVMTRAGGLVKDLGLIAPRTIDTPLMPENVMHAPKRVVPLGSGWIAFASWTNRTGHPVSRFTTTWTLPAAPSTQSDQTIFLFNGIQNKTMIYQPVLQWGSSAAGGGNFWAVASWYADGQNGPASYSSLVRVNPGRTLVGVMTLTAQNGGLFNYHCEFQGVANTGLDIINQQELTFLIETLEAYGITRCSDYPNTDSTLFSAIEVETGTTKPVLNWAASNSVTDCGQKALVISDAEGTGQVEIFYRGPTGWHHNDLTVAARAPGAAGNPAGYTWDVDKTQHVVYRGGDGHIHELWFNSAWNHNDLTIAARAPGAAGDPAGYTWNVDSTQHVVYRGDDGHIHELWFNGAWNHNDLTVAARAPGAAGNPTGYTWNVDSTQHVVYRGGDGHIHELWFNGAWNHNDLTVAARAPGAAGDPAGYTWNVDSTQHVVYRGVDGHIHELWFNGAWNHNDLTVAARAPGAVGDPAGYTWNVDNTQHVAYRSGDGHIHELWFNGAWNHNDLTVAARAPGAAGDPAGYTWDVDRTQHVVYRGSDGHIHELWFNGAWNHNDLTVVTIGAPGTAGDPAGYTWDVDRTQHIVYRAGDGHIHELWFNVA